MKKIPSKKARITWREEQDKNMRIIGLDYGTKTVGVAVSDALMITAQPLETIERKSAILKIISMLLFFVDMEMKIKFSLGIMN